MGLLCGFCLVQALRLNESLKRQDEVWAGRMQEALRAQVSNFEAHLQQIRDHEEARALELLKAQHQALLVRGPIVVV